MIEDVDTGLSTSTGGTFIPEINQIWDGMFLCLIYQVYIAILSSDNIAP
jgi:hypothetical protein